MPKNGTKKCAIATLLTFSTKQRKIVQRFYPRKDFFYTNVVCTLVCFYISASCLAVSRSLAVFPSLAISPSLSVTPQPAVSPVQPYLGTLRCHIPATYRMSRHSVPCRYRLLVPWRMVTCRHPITSTAPCTLPLTLQEQI